MTWCPGKSISAQLVRIHTLALVAGRCCWSVRATSGLESPLQNAVLHVLVLSSSVSMSELYVLFQNYVLRARNALNSVLAVLPAQRQCVLLVYSSPAVLLFQVIVSRGGRFLEAPVSGNQQLSNDGMLVILAAGDRGLYEDCSSCFQAMGKTSFFLGN